MICVLDVTAGPARGKRFWLRSNQQVEIGRLSSADFAIPADPHMSRRHLILEGTQSAFRVRDVGSVNGTFVNDAKISAVELCSGDCIRAGETTFEVSVLDDQDNPHAKDGLSFSSMSSVGRSVESSFSVVDAPGLRAEPSDSVRNSIDARASGSADLPLRMLSHSRPDESDESDSESTKRCQLPVDFALENSSRRNSQQGTILGNNSWWSDYDFRVSDIPCLLDEATHPNAGTSRLPEILQRLESEFALTAIVDVERLGRYGRQQVGVMVEHGLVEWHGPSVCSVQDDRSRDFVRLIESSLCQDAITLVGTRTPLDILWLREIIRQAPRPSILSGQLRKSNSPLIEQLLSNVEFVIFERDRSGCLSLLLRDLIELSD